MGNKELPFELQGLEAALTRGVSVLELAVANLERVAFSALETLMKRVPPPPPPLLLILPQPPDHAVKGHITRRRTGAIVVFTPIRKRPRSSQDCRK